MHVETVFGKDFTLQNIYISDVPRGKRSTVRPIKSTIQETSTHCTPFSICQPPESHFKLSDSETRYTRLPQDGNESLSNVRYVQI